MSANKLTKKDIVQSLVAGGTVQRRHAVGVVQGVLDSISQALREGKSVELRNFGVFEVQVRRARVGRNPNKPANPITIPEQWVVKFKVGKELRRGVRRIPTH
jgi:nucleoid DNA-binding protein